MIQRYCDGRIPQRNISDEGLLLAKRAGVDTDEAAVSDFVAHARDEFIRYFDNFAFSKALEEVWAIVARVDKMISDAKPWDLAKDASQRQTLNAVLYRAAESLRWLSVLLYPVIPNAAHDAYAQLGLTDNPSKIDPGDLEWGQLSETTETGEVKPLFPRIDKTKIMDDIKNKESAIRSLASEAAETRPSGTVQSATDDRRITAQG